LLAGPDDTVEKIKEIVGPNFVEQSYDLMLGSLFANFEGYINSKLGPRADRVFSFGPNSGDGPIVVDKTARMISRLGLCGMTIDHYYEPNKPDAPISMSRALPKEIDSLPQTVPTYVYLQNLPRLVNRAVFYENDERGQALELVGCARFKIPRLGYILAKQLSQPPESALKNSDFLHLDETGFVECKARTKALCDHISSGRFCPFYDSISVPWPSLELFLNEDSTIVGVPEHENLQGPLSRFLMNGVDKKGWKGKLTI